MSFLIYFSLRQMYLHCLDDTNRVVSMKWSICIRSNANWELMHMNAPDLLVD